VEEEEKGLLPAVCHGGHGWRALVHSWPAGGQRTVVLRRCVVAGGRQPTPRQTGGRAPWAATSLRTEDKEKDTNRK